VPLRKQTSRPRDNHGKAVQSLVIITLEHYYRFTDFIQGAAHTYDSGAASVAASLERELRKEVEENLVPALTLYSACLQSGFTLDAVRRILTSCASAIQTFWSIHRKLLRLIFGPWVLPEANIFLEQCMEAMTTRPAASLVLTDGSTFKTEDPMGEPTIIGIPKIFYGAPLTWPAIAHELAHNILRKRKFVPRGSEKFADWSLELASDYMGTLLLGPTFLGASVESLILRRFVFADMPSHPSSRRRFAFLFATMPESWRNDPIIKHCAQLFSCLEAATEDKEKELSKNLIPAYIERCLCCDQPLRKMIDSKGSEKEYRAMIDSLPDDVSKIPITKYRLDPETVNQLASQLESGIPACAVTSTPKSLHKLVLSLSRLRVKDRNERFEQLASAAIQKPATAAQIIHAGWHFRLARLGSKFDTYMQSFEEAKRWELLDELGKEFLFVDEFILASLNTSHFHRAVEGLNASV
jgi:hypothetical protein